MLNHRRCVPSCPLGVLVLLFAAPALAWPPGGNGGGGGGNGGGGGGEDPPANLPTFSIQPLGTLGGETSTAEGLNVFGDVVGVSEVSGGGTEPYLYTAAEGMQSINVLTDGPLATPQRTLFRDGLFYVANQGWHTGGGSVVRFDAVTGEFIDYFVQVGSGGLERPAPMIFGPDGHLYVPTHSGPETRRNRIAKYDGSTGAYLGDFVPHGLGGMDGITDLKFGPDVDGDGESDLFVSSARTDEVLAYGGVDGTFLGDFVAAGVGGLDGSASMVFRDIDDDGTPELLVAGMNSVNVLVYDGTTGAFLGEFVDSAALQSYVSKLQDVQFGPDGDLYVTGMSHVDTINGTDPQAQVLRFDGETGAFVELFIPPGTGWQSAAPRMTFDGQGDVYLNSGDTNQILRYQGPLSADPGEFSDVFIEGVGFILVTARDINDGGQIVGWGHPLGRRLLFNERAAYRYTPPAPGDLVGRVDDLGVPGLNFDEEATAINYDGDVAGHFVSEATGKVHAFLWSEQTGPIDLGTLAGQDTFVTGLSNRSGGDVLVCGYAQTSSGARAWRFDTATGTMQNLGLISGSSGASYAWDVNDAGDVVGVASAGTKNRAFLRTLGGGMTDLGTLGGNHSVATAINLFGDVVGMSDTSTKSRNNRYQAFLQTSADGMFKLEPQIVNLPASLELEIRPHRISDAGQIIGPGTGGVTEAYIITPEP